MNNGPSDVNTDWRQFSANPVDPKVSRYLKDETNRLCKPSTLSFMDHVKAESLNKSVLDIGCAEHDQSHWNSKEWKHGEICKWSSDVMGIDIVPAAVKALCEKGYNVQLVDATSDVFLGRKFDVIVIGDVIEHVDNPVGLLRFAARHINHHGIIICHTPNPFYWSFFLRAIRDGVMIENAEHTSWITPCNLIELAHRSGLSLVEYRPTFSGSIKSKIARWIFSLLSNRPPEIFSGSNTYLLKTHSTSRLQPHQTSPV